MSDEQAQAPKVTLDELAAARDDGAVVVDVRRPEEYAAGHIPGVVHLPLDELEARWQELPSDQRLWVVCQGGGRARTAATALTGAGLDAVWVDGGTGGWAEEGREIEQG